MVTSRWRTARSPYILGSLVGIVLFWIYSPFYPTSFATHSAHHDRSHVAIKRRVALASNFFYHFDVWIPVAHTIAQVFQSEDNIRPYGRQPFAHGFQEISDHLGLVKKPIEPTSSFISDLKRTDLFPGDPGAMIDVVVLGTCETDMHEWSNGLLEAWDARPADQKFKLVCIVHNILDHGWHRYIPLWAARGAFRILPIGDHVARGFRRKFQYQADDKDLALFGSFLEHIDIDVHVPILQLPEYGTRRTSDTRQLSKAMIQGSFDRDRRDYDGAFAGLVAALKHDAVLWGYQPQQSPSAASPQPYEPLIASDIEPFTLHLAGKGELDIPKELTNIVVVHRNLEYDAFYNLTQSMDIIIPAFPSAEYYESQASSTIVMAMQCGVPILTTKRIREAYGYIDDDRVVITRPQAIREIEAIGILRATNAPTSSLLSSLSATAAADPPGSFLRDLERMRAEGYHRPQAGFAQFKQGIFTKNREAVVRLLQGRPGEF